MAYRHVSAMLNETLANLNCKPGGIYVDCTLGGAGHAKAICERIAPNGRLVAIDQDADAIANGRARLSSYGGGVTFFHGNFVDLPAYLAQLQIEAVDGILLDLGLSQNQIESSGRGFTFQKDEPLDMRMDVRSETTAADLINRLSESEMARLFREYGEERWAKRIAGRIAAARRVAPVRTTSELARLVISAVPAGAAARQKIHPATRIFMALRIAVNRELERLAQFLEESIDWLKRGGRLCVLSFHSLEDRMVKRHFKKMAHPCTCPPDLPRCSCGRQAMVRLITKRVLRPSTREVAQNPMARSTRLRCLEKVA
ncbi:MAG: 16S rRNA (cytosine(1402)-N(4))-methyltransferase RsmH [Desulfatitalea sp.]|nr:16S rRNA (cytosine(1402)-N(4))-methyltransferase RsmH [Desulfatitalea sp.]NNK01703.1 16S rRNA (cytosine(1402)-N(4))-methyltransferase RsmH [Desulfatitalea sp.]